MIIRSINKAKKGLQLMAETAKKKWDDEAVAALTAGYREGDPSSVEELMETLGRSKREVIGKLVHLRMYVAPDKPAPKAKDEGPTKKEILRAIEDAGFEVTGFEGATKAALARLAVSVGASLPE